MTKLTAHTFIPGAVVSKCLLYTEVLRRISRNDALSLTQTHYSIRICVAVHVKPGSPPIADRTHLEDQSSLDTVTLQATLIYHTMLVYLDTPLH